MSDPAHDGAAAPSPRPGTGGVIDPAALAGLEAVLFLADEPLELGDLVTALDHDEDTVLVHLDELAQRLEERQSGLTVRHVAGGWRLATDPATDAYVERHLLTGRSGRLSQAALETLAVVAYRQPISRGDVSDIRGVNADGAIRSLVQRGMLTEVGRDDGPGQAILFGTTTRFLEELGLVSLDDLPDMADYMEGDAPDEPVGTDLRAARRALQAGHRLPATGRATWDGETVDDEPGELLQLRAQRREAFSELTDDLERVAQAAMARLHEAVSVAEKAPEGDDRGRDGSASEVAEPGGGRAADGDGGVAGSATPGRDGGPAGESGDGGGEA